MLDDLGASVDPSQIVSLDDYCDWFVESMRLPEFLSFPDAYKKRQIYSCEQVCPEHDCSFAEQDGAFYHFTLAYNYYHSDFESFSDDAINAHPFGDFHHSKTLRDLIQPGAQPCLAIRRIIKNLTSRKHISNCSNDLINKWR